MPYLTKPTAIKALIDEIAAAKILWLDTETANWNTFQPKLSLIQVLADPTDLTGDRADILDVLDRPDLADYFIAKIMVNPKIEKVFHNSGYDLIFLGKSQAQNVTCTLTIAKQARNNSPEIQQLTNLKLKTIAAELCQFTDIDIEEQGSDWGKRSLSPKQLQYAKMDVVYLAQVHRRLLEIVNPQLAMATFNQNPPQVSHSSFSVTKVRIAFECPRLFYLYHHFKDNTLFLPPNTTLGIGAGFHKLADNFINLAKQEGKFSELFQSSQLELGTVAAEMQQLFYQLAFFPYLQTESQKDPDKATALLQLWQGLIGLIHRWAEILIQNRPYFSAEELIAQTFVTENKSVTYDFTLPNGKLQKVTGVFDSLFFDAAKQRFCMVEFKTYQPVDPSAQLAQVALYSYMLKMRKNMPVDSAVYCVLPEFQESYFAWEKLESTVNQLIPHKLQQMQEWLQWQPSQPSPPPLTAQPKLCQICPQQQKCQSYFEADSASLPTPQPITISPPPANSIPLLSPPPAINAEGLGAQLVATLKSFNINAEYHGAAIGYAFIRIKLKPHSGVKIAALLKLAADLQVQLGLTAPPAIAPQAGYVSVDLPRSDRQVAKFADYIQPQYLPPTASVKIAIGVNLDGKLVQANLSDPNTCHFLVGGTTGSGKSEFLRSLLLSLIYRHSPQNLRIALVDPKRVTFPEFEQMPWLHSPIVKDSDRALKLMAELIAEMEGRYQQFEKASCSGISQYNQQAAQPLPRIVCIFDEYADFMADKDIRTELEAHIKRLGAMARAAGIHLIVATQRPEAKVVTPIIRSNLPGRVALRTASEADSTIILGSNQKSAAYLLGKGDLLYQVGAELHRLQSPFISQIQLPAN
jgi:S-DNA-T family DNA segregation ATPase FtsK/SpoIIIE